jgi:hypothetical protein
MNTVSPGPGPQFRKALLIDVDQHEVLHGRRIGRTLCPVVRGELERRVTSRPMAITAAAAMPPGSQEKRASLEATETPFLGLEGV